MARKAAASVGRKPLVEPSSKPKKNKPVRAALPVEIGAALAGSQIVGEVVVRPLASVKPNTWNPNRMTDFDRESLTVGLREDGWLKAQSLLIWGTDNKGKRRDVIIDGEQRWTVAAAAGFTEGPMVFLDGVSERDAKKLTIKFDKKRGRFDDYAIGSLVRELAAGSEDPNLGIDLGFDEKEFKALLASADSGDLSGADLDAYKEQYGVIVMCRNEAHQKEIFDRLVTDGLDCKVVVT